MTQITPPDIQPIQNHSFIELVIAVAMGVTIGVVAGAVLLSALGVL